VRVSRLFQRNSYDPLVSPAEIDPQPPDATGRYPAGQFDAIRNKCCSRCPRGVGAAESVLSHSMFLSLSGFESIEWKLDAMEIVQELWPLSDAPSDEISIYDGPDKFLADFQSVSPLHQTIFAAYWLQAEVLNGGLKQFFSNDTGVLAPEAVSSCQTLGMPQLAKKIEEAMAWFGTPYPRDREAREPALEAYAERHPDDECPFGELDEVVGNLIYDESPGLEQAALRFIRAQESKIHVN
jgi:hypothetical protein